jgi:hypothetical protein
MHFAINTALAMRRGETGADGEYHKIKLIKKDRYLIFATSRGYFAK